MDKEVCFGVDSVMPVLMRIDLYGFPSKASSFGKVTNRWQINIRVLMLNKVETRMSA
jgi:hypothetical protein